MISDGYVLLLLLVVVVFVSDLQVFAFYHVLLSVIPTPWTYMVLDVLSCYLIWLYWQYLPKDMCSSQKCWSLQAADVMAAWYSPNKLCDVLVYYSSCTYDDWYDLYLLVPYSLTLNLEIYILAHLLCGLLLDVVTSMIWFLLDFLSCMTMSGLLQGTCLSVMIGESLRIAAFSFSITCSGLCWY